MIVVIAAVAQLLSTDSPEDIQRGLVGRLGYDPEVCDNGSACETTVWDCNGNLIGTGKTRAEALADAVVWLDSNPEPEPAEDGSAIEHEHWLRSGK